MPGPGEEEQFFEKLESEYKRLWDRLGSHVNRENKEAFKELRTDFFRRFNVAKETFQTGFKLGVIAKNTAYLAIVESCRANNLKPPSKEEFMGLAWGEMWGKFNMTTHLMYEIYAMEAQENNLINDENVIKTIVDHFELYFP